MFFKNSIFFLTMITKGNLKKFLLRWVFELWIYIVNLISFAFIFYYFYMCGSGSVFRIRIHILIRIRIQEAPEYGSNKDPDPQHCFVLKNTLWTVKRKYLNRERTCIRKKPRSTLIRHTGFISKKKYRTVETRMVGSELTIFGNIIGAFLHKHTGICWRLHTTPPQVAAL